MRALWFWITLLIQSFGEWLLQPEPDYSTWTNPAKDRSLRGKARRKARQGR